MNNVMIDIETLGTAANSVILSIGAVQFGPDGLGNEFYTAIDIDSCLNSGLQVDGRTVAWWMVQTAEARAVFNERGGELQEALLSLSGAFDWKGDTLVWCNGLSFDLPILDTAYRACGLAVPWRYYNGRDYRTFKREHSSELVSSLEVEPTVAHNALADAKAQALTLLAIRDAVRHDRLRAA